MKKFILKSAFVAFLSIFNQAINAQVYPTNASAVGACDGSAYLADSTYSTWTWMSGNNILQTGGTSVTNLCEGSYAVNLTGSLIYADTSYYFTITANNNPCLNFGGSILSQAATSPVLCDGMLSVALSGGTTPYTYNWSGNGMNYTTSSISGLCSNATYILNVVDANGCQLTLTGIVSDSSVTSNDSLFVYPYTTDVTADGVCDGVVDFQTNAVAPFEIYLSNGMVSSTGFFDSLCQGIYSAMILDANGDSLNVNFIISNPANNFNNVVVGDSLFVDSIMSDLQTYCNINYTGIDSVYISNYTFNGNIVTVNWIVASADSSTTISVSYTLTAGTGNYLLGLSVYCPGKSLGNYFTANDALYFDPTASITEIYDATVTIYPVPVYDNLTVQTKEIGDYQITVFDNSGRMILSNQFSNTNMFQLNTSSLSKGKYVLQIKGKTGIISKSIVK